MKLLRRLGILLLTTLVLVACSSGGGPGGGAEDPSNGKDNGEHTPDPTGSLAITLSVNKTMVYFEDHAELTATVTGPNAESATVTWEATGGEFSAKSTNGATWVAPTDEGRFEITATATLGSEIVSDTVEISTEPDPERNYIVVSTNLPIDGITTFNEEVSINASIIGPDAAGAQFEWAIASGPGRLFPLAGADTTLTTDETAGTTTVQVKARAGTERLEKTIDLEVLVPLEIVGVTPSSPHVGIGNTVELEVELGGYYAHEAQVKWDYTSLGLLDPNNPGALRGALVGPRNTSTVVYRAPNLYGYPTDPASLKESVQVSAFHAASATDTGRTSVPITVGFCDAGDYTDSENPCMIRNIYQLQGIAQSADHMKGYYQLTDNIDAKITETWNNGEGFKPLAWGITPFSGSFDGNNKSVNNLHIDREANGIGIFQTLAGKVHNLTINNSFVRGNSLVGILAGHTRGAPAISDVHIVDSWAVGSHVVGGLIGAAMGSENEPEHKINIERASVRDSTVRMTALQAPSDPQLTGFVGGLFGLVASRGQISDVEVSDTIIDAYEKYAGGVTAVTHPDMEIDGAVIHDVQITSYNVTSSETGGVVGWNHGTIRNSSVEDVFVSGSGSYVGGIIGLNGKDATVANTSGTSIEIRNTGTQGFIGVGGFVGTNEGLIDSGRITDLRTLSGVGLGGFAYRNQPTGIITNSHVHDSYIGILGSSSNPDYENYAGFAVQNFGKIERSGVLNTSVVGAYSNVGGFVQRNNSDAVILESFVYSPNHMVAADENHVGGFVQSNLGEIGYSYAVVEEVRGRSNVGGFADYHHGNQAGSNGLIQYSFVQAKVTSTGQAATRGGMVATNSHPNKTRVAWSFWNRSAAGINDSEGGIPVPASEFQKQQTYEGQNWKFDGSPGAQWQMPSSAQPGPQVPDLINNSRF